MVNPDGSPASQVPVRSVNPPGANSVSRADGVAQLIVNTLPGASQLYLRVHTQRIFWACPIKLDSLIYFPES